MHAFSTIERQTNGAFWTWNGDVLKPTFSPSMNVSTEPIIENGVMLVPASRCHYILTDGIISYLNDCTHRWRNLCVVLPDLPDWLRDPEPA
jgi:hypothetical protein